MNKKKCKTLGCNNFEVIFNFMDDELAFELRRYAIYGYCRKCSKALLRIYKFNELEKMKEEIEEKKEDDN